MPVGLKDVVPRSIGEQRHTCDGAAGVVQPPDSLPPPSTAAPENAERARTAEPRRLEIGDVGMVYRR